MGLTGTRGARGGKNDLRRDHRRSPNEEPQMNIPQDSSYRPPARGQAAGSPGGPHPSSATDARDNTGDFADKVRVEGREQVQHYRDAAADKLDTLASSVEAAAAELQDEDVAHLSGHISDMASSLGRLSDGLREKSADQILHDVRRVARENPTLFIAGSVAIGFGIARFARASASGGTLRGGQSPSNEPSTRTRWTDPDASVPGTTARPATGNDTIDTTSPGGLTGVIPAAPGPSASTADAISARAGAAASDTPIGTPSPTDTFSGRTEP
jgi:hypothetical protein